MRFLFWNLGRRPLLHLVAEAVDEHQVDVIVIAEGPELTPNETAQVLNRRSKRRYSPPAFGTPGRIRLLSCLPRRAVRPLDERQWLSGYRIKSPLGPELLLVAAHLSSKLYQDEREQLLAAPRLRAFLKELEAKVKHCRSVIVGDFNMNPFEGGMVGADGLHAVMSRTVAMRRERTVEGEIREFLYNPMWSHFGDRAPSPPGTYFYQGSSQIVYFWNIFDQVLVRPDLLPYFEDEDVKVVTKIGATSLLDSQGRPDESVGSDHLPIVFDVLIERAITNGVDSMEEPRQAC